MWFFSAGSKIVTYMVTIGGFILFYGISKGVIETASEFDLEKAK